LKFLIYLLMETRMTTLRQAVLNGTLDQFIADHEADEPGDEALFNATLAAMAGTSRVVPAASDEAPSDG
jgi:hypothetical protein